MHSVAIKVLIDQVRHLNSAIEASYDEVWTPASSDARASLIAELESIEATIEFLESVQ